MQPVLTRTGQLQDSSKLDWQLWALNINVSELGCVPEVGVSAMIFFILRVRGLLESHAITLSKADSAEENCPAIICLGHN